MAKCNYCGDETDFPYTCNYCGRYHCSNHRLPEKHSCPEIYGATTLGPEFRKTGSSGDSDDKTLTARVEPGTVGTRKASPTSKSPPVETKRDRSKGRSASPNSTVNSSSVSTHLKRIAILAVFLIVGALLFTGYGPVTIGEFSDSGAAGPVMNSTPTTARLTPSEVVAQSQSGTQTSELDRARIERLVHVEINERRQKHGLPVLDHDQTLREIARRHSAVMAANGEIFHTQPDGDDFQDRYQQAGYDCRVSTGENSYTTGGENVAKTWYEVDVITEFGTVRYDTPRELAKGIVNQWMNSSGHRENILKPYWNNEGIGLNVTRENGDMAVYVTQNFC